jgi:uncharacterized protein YecE (DUF72 family)
MGRGDKANVAVDFADSDKYPEFFDVTADFVYLRLESAKAAEQTGYSPDDLDLWTRHIGEWMEGGAPADLPTIAKTPAPKQPRDCFVYAINGAKERAPAAAMALIEKLRR